jgi:flagellar protein FliO/FliZ
MYRSAATVASAASFFACRAMAQTSAIATQVSPPSATEGLLHSLIGLIVVVALIFSAGWMVKRFRPHIQSRSGLLVLGSASVGTRERVVLVRYLDEVMVLGVAAGQVTLLKSAPAPAEEARPPMPANLAFIERLKHAMKASRG